MKYVVRQDQAVTITGSISEEGSSVSEIYDDSPINISRGILQFEHTDGLNYVNFGLRKKAQLSHAHKNVCFELIYGLGLGILVPKSDVTLLGRQRHDAIHLSGYGIDINGGLRFNLSRRWFLQTEIKSGYINLPSIRKTVNKATNASQDLGYVQYNILFGGNMFVKKSKRVE